MMTFSSSSSMATFLVRTVAFGGAAIVAASAQQQQDIPQVAIANGFDTLVTALQAADLVGALASPNGPFTVFAPTDEAFDNLPDDLVGCLLNDIPVLTDILLYHVAEGKVLASQLSDGQEIATLLDGAEVTVDIRSDGVLINDAMVLATDVEASNGVVHVINQVLVPPRIDVTAFLDACTGGGSSSSSDDRDECTYLGVARSAGQYLTGPTHTCLCTTGGHWVQCRTNTQADTRKTIQQFVLDTDNFSTLETAVIQADLVGVLEGSGPFTLFAPTDAAFADVPTAVMNFLLDDDNKDVLGQVLKYHVTAGEINSKDLPEGTLKNVDTVQGGNDQLTATKTCYTTMQIASGRPNCDTYSVTLDETSNAIVTDIQASNGIIHIINKVMIPPSLRAAVAGLL